MQKLTKTILVCSIALACCASAPADVRQPLEAFPLFRCLFRVELEEVGDDFGFGRVGRKAVGGKYGAVVRLVRGAEIGRHRERRRINERNQQFPSCFCISRFVAIDL